MHDYLYSHKSHKIGKQSSVLQSHCSLFFLLCFYFHVNKTINIIIKGYYEGYLV